MMAYGLLAILIVLIVALLALAVAAWFLLRPSSSQKSATFNVKTQPIVQRFVSNDLKKRAFIIRLNEGGYKLVYQRYSNKVISLSGEVAGWQVLPNKPVIDSLASAVEIAQEWVHSEE